MSQKPIFSGNALSRIITRLTVRARCNAVTTQNKIVLQRFSVQFKKFFQHNIILYSFR